MCRCEPSLRHRSDGVEVRQLVGLYRSDMIYFAAQHFFSCFFLVLKRKKLVLDIPFLPICFSFRGEHRVVDRETTL